MLALLLIGLGLLLLAMGITKLIRRPGSRPIGAPRPPTRKAVHRAPPREDVEHVLYVARWAHNERPCYFGISNDQMDREAGHKRRSWWWPYCTGQLQVVGRFPNRTEALAAEKRTIYRAAMAGEQLTNVQHNPRRPVRRSDVRLAA